MKATLLIFTLLLSLNVFAEGQVETEDCSKISQTRSESESTKADVKSESDNGVNQG